MEALNEKLAKSWDAQAAGSRANGMYELAKANERIAAGYREGAYPPPAHAYIPVSIAADERRPV